MKTWEHIFHKHTHKTHTSTTLQMKSKVAYIVSDLALKGFLVGLGLDLVYMYYNEYITYTMLAWPSP